MNAIDNVIVRTLSSAAESVRVDGLAVLIENTGESAVYFKERRFDGADATPQNGFRLAPGAVTAVPLTALELSLCADGTSEVRLLVLDCC